MLSALVVIGTLRVNVIKQIDYILRGNWYTFKGDNYVKIVFTPFWKGVHSERKELAPFWRKFFPFWVAIFSEGIWCVWRQTGSHKSYLPYKYGNEDADRIVWSESGLLAISNYILRVNTDTVCKQHRLQRHDCTCDPCFTVVNPWGGS